MFILEKLLQYLLIVIFQSISFIWYVPHCRNKTSFVDIKLYYMKQKYQLRNSGAFKINHFRMHHQKLLLNVMIIC